MMPLQPGGPVWLYGLLTVTRDGRDVMLAHYGRYVDLKPAGEHGIAEFDDAHGVFTKVLDLEGREPPDTWRCIHNHSNPLRVSAGDGDYFYYATPFAGVRVPARYEDVLNPACYEALRWDEQGRRWAWQKEDPPTTQREEARLVREGRLPEAETRYALRDAATDHPIYLHWGSIAWNEYRKRYLLIGLQRGDGESPSVLGEVWYAEADHPAGPWRAAVKIASHPEYSYYNVRHHAFLDADGGRVIYFEGTYTHTFSGNPATTPRYDYNQLMYRLDLSDARLSPAHAAGVGKAD